MEKYLTVEDIKQIKDDLHSLGKWQLADKFVDYVNMVYELQQDDSKTTLTKDILLVAEEKSTRFVIGGKEYILNFRKALFNNDEYVVEVLKEKGKHELVSIAELDIKEVDI